MAKVKASDKLSFPLRLDLAPILASDAPPRAPALRDTAYELMSILIHKGPSASHGHYGALDAALPCMHATLLLPLRRCWSEPYLLLLRNPLSR